MAMIYNEEAEKAVIGGILLDFEKTMPLAVDLISPGDFLNPFCKDIYTVFVQEFKRGNVCDSATLKSELQNQEAFAVAISCAQYVPTLSRMTQYIKIVHDCGKLRKAREAADDLITSIDGGDFQECQKKASDLLQCFNDDSGSKIVSSKQMFLDFTGAQDSKKEYIKLGFQKLDSHLFIAKGYYIIVGGRPSSGKTALTLQMMLNVAKKHKCIYFSLETSPEIIGERLMACYTRTPLSDIKHRDIKEDKWDQITSAYDAFSNLSFLVARASGFTVEQIRAEIIRTKAEVAFIDYLTLINAQGKSMFEKATNISIDLHNLAQQTGCVIVALSQLSREGKENADMTSLRDSGQIEQDADAVLLIGRDKTEDDIRYVNVAKNKDGVTGEIPFRFYGGYQCFEEIEVR